MVALVKQTASRRLSKDCSHETSTHSKVWRRAEKGDTVDNISVYTRARGRVRACE